MLYGRSDIRQRSVGLVLVALLLFSATSHAEPAHKEKHANRHWHGYGFLPGYRPPQQVAWERARARGPVFYWDARPGFYRGRWNGGGFGPCWERTPIGPMWTCGR